MVADHCAFLSLKKRGFFFTPFFNTRVTWISYWVAPSIGSHSKFTSRRISLANAKDPLSSVHMSTAISEVNTNLRLGTYYLKHVLTLLDNQPLLASAAYNAGPRRAWQWRDEKPLEGAIYAETIPFNETRDYVKKVMSNSMYYASTFGHQVKTLSQRLGIVGPKPVGVSVSEIENKGP